MECIIECLTDGTGLRISFGEVELEIKEDGFCLAIEAAAASAVVEDDWLRSFHRFLLFCEGESVLAETVMIDEADEDTTAGEGDLSCCWGGL